MSRNLHHALLGLDGLVRLGEHLHAIGDRRRACRHGLGRLFDIDKTHPAIRRDGQLLVITEVGNVDVQRAGRVHDHASLGNTDLFAVDF